MNDEHAISTIRYLGAMPLDYWGQAQLMKLSSRFPSCPLVTIRH